jgi:protein transport protein SEC24
LLLFLQIFETRVNGCHVNPPSSSTRFVVRDRGNASPRLLRASLNTVPATNDMLSNSGMQFALAVQPLALPDPDDDPVLVRVMRCRGFLWKLKVEAHVSDCCKSGLY